MTSQKIIILGSHGVDTSVAYKKFNLSPSILLTNVDQNYTVGHTSRQEFKTDLELERILSSADVVYWADPDPKDFGSNKIYFYFLNWIKQYQYKHKNISNFDSINPNPFEWKYTLPTITADDLIALGCSFTAGIGIPDNAHRFANIVANELGLNCVNLGQPGGSFQKIYDIFTQLDFIAGQTVILQIPPIGRLRHCQDNHVLNDVLFANSQSAPNLINHMVMVYNASYLFYQLLTNVRLMVKYARVKKLKLVFLLFNYKSNVCGNSEEQMYFYEFPEFIPNFALQNYLVDFGTDNMHPGIESNKIVAKEIVLHLQRCYNNN